MQNTAIEFEASAGHRASDGPAILQPADQAAGETYAELTSLIERLHRRQLDMLRLELDRLGIDAINPAQALMLMRLEDQQMTVRDLIGRGYYLGTNVSYNIKRLVKAGYAEQKRSTHDRRSLRVQTSALGRELCARLTAAEASCATAMSTGTQGDEDMQTACRALRRLERLWSDRLQFDRR